MWIKVAMVAVAGVAGVAGATTVAGAATLAGIAGEVGAVVEPGGERPVTEHYVSFSPKNSPRARPLIVSSRCYPLG